MVGTTPPPNPLPQGEGEYSIRQPPYPELHGVGFGHDGENRSLAGAAGHAAGAPRDPAERWLILGARHSLAATLADQRTGCRVVLPPADAAPADWDRLLAADPTRPWSGVLYLAARDGAAESVPARAERLAGEALGLIRALNKQAAPPRLWLVTEGAQAVTADDAIAPEHAALWGLYRGALSELPALAGGLIDLPLAGDAGAAAPALAAALWARIDAPDGEDQVALRATSTGASGMSRPLAGPLIGPLAGPADALPVTPAKAGFRDWPAGIQEPRMPASAGMTGLQAAAADRTDNPPAGTNEIAAYAARLRPRRFDPPSPRTAGVRPDGRYLITGGLGALGLHMAQWLAGQGARSLVLLGRRAVPEGPAADQIVRLRDRGIEIRLAAADVSDRAELAAALAGHGPFAGIIHAAGVSDLRPLAEMTRDALHATLAAKVAGAWNLHELTLGQPLGMFLCLSSVAAVWGGRGQAHYAAANAFLDGLVQVPPPAEPGGNQHRLRSLARRGHGHRRGARLVATHRPAADAPGCGAGGPRRSARCGRIAGGDGGAGLAALSRGLPGSPAEQAAVGDRRGAARGGGGLVGPSEAPQQVPPEDRQAWIEALVDRTLGEVLRIAPAALDPVAGFFDLGMDSLTAVEFAQALERRLGRKLPTTLAMDHPNRAALADYLLRVLFCDDVRQAHRPAAAATDEPIAVIGLACRFPGANDPDSYWRLLSDGVDAIREVPPDRWDIAAWYDPDPSVPGKMYTSRGGFLDQIDQFDARLFRITPREAMGLDPQQRVLLETAWEALHNARQSPDALRGSRSGVYVGVGASEYAQLTTSGGAEALDAYFGTGNALNVIAGRCAYVLGLQGRRRHAGHRVLFIAGGGAPGGARAARGGLRPGAGRRRQPDGQPARHRGGLPRAHAGPGRALQDVRRGGEWLCPRRGLRRGGAEAPVRRAARRRPRSWR